MSGTHILLPLLLLACDEQPPTAVGNQAPIADAGLDQVASSDAPIVLDGAGSYDPDGDGITYHWALERAPAGSAVSERAFPDNHAAVPQTALRPDVPGTYIVELWVEDDAGARSAVDLVTITVVAGDAPIADARAAAVGLTGEAIALDGSWSYDPLGHPLTYAWGLASAPLNSSLSVVDGAGLDVASLVPDVPGQYVLSLTVNNGFTDSVPDLAYVAVEPAEPRAPIADAGPDPRGAQDCKQVPLDGSGSYDPDGAALAYRWDLQDQPEGSDASRDDFDDPAAAEPTFYPDVAGTYTASLAVFDGAAWSAPDLVTIEAAERRSNAPPRVNAGASVSLDLGSAACERRGGVYRCDPCAAVMVALGTDARVDDPDGDPTALLWTSGDDLRIADPDRLETEVLLSEVYPQRPNACHDTTYRISLEATDCPGEVDSDYIDIVATCCGTP